MDISAASGRPRPPVSGSRVRTQAAILLQEAASGRVPRLFPPQGGSIPAARSLVRRQGVAIPAGSGLLLPQGVTSGRVAVTSRSRAAPSPDAGSHSLPQGTLSQSGCGSPRRKQRHPLPGGDWCPDSPEECCGYFHPMKEGAASGLKELSSPLDGRGHPRRGLRPDWSSPAARSRVRTSAAVISSGAPATAARGCVRSLRPDATPCHSPAG